MLIKNITILILFLAGGLSYGQGISLKLGSNSIAQNQYYTISVTVTNDNIKSSPVFPEIPGFRKAGISQNQSMNISFGSSTSSITLTQNYIPTKQGTFKLAPFKMKVNGQVLESKGATIKVGAPAQRQQSRSSSPFGFGSDPFDMMRKMEEEMFGRRSNQPKEFQDFKEDVFFSIIPSKTEVYKGEGVTITASMYISAQDWNRRRIDADYLANRERMKKEITPGHVWEEITPLNDQFEVSGVEINGKQYARVIVYQSTYYPLTAEDIKIPKFRFEAIKKLRTKHYFPLGSGNVKPENINLYSSPRTIKVKPLPEHPLKDQVSVGRYKLVETLASDSLKTGSSAEYSFKIAGTGNIVAIGAPDVQEDEQLKIYPPNELQSINVNAGKVNGSKTYQYYLIPNEPGEIDLSDYFQWVYFDPYRKVYDTLASSKKIVATGESQKDLVIASKDLGTFYNRIDSENSEPVDLRERKGYIWWSVGTMAGGMLILILLILWKKREEQKKKRGSLL